MSTNKQFVSLANQLPVLAKAYYSHLSGTPQEVEKKQKQLLKLVEKIHKELRTKGSALVKIPAPAAKPTKSAKKMMVAAAAFSDSHCPPNMIKCLDGTCVPAGTSCSAD